MTDPKLPSQPKHYYSQETEVIKIFSAIEKELKDTKAKFHFSKRNKFKL